MRHEKNPEDSSSQGWRKGGNLMEQVFYRTDFFKNHAVTMTRGISHAPFGHKTTETPHDPDRRGSGART